MKDVISKEKTKELIDRAYNTAKAHGFHDTDLSLEHMLMLVVSEVSEAVEADRKDRHADIKGFIENVNVYPDYSDRFNAYIKGSVEEELADVCIRLFDICGALAIIPDRPMDRSLVYARESMIYGKSFCESCFYLCSMLTIPTLRAFGKYRALLGGSLWFVYEICDYYKIDIMQHIEWKMQYNELRPMRHGKNY